MAAIASKTGGSTVVGQSKRVSRQQKIVRKAMSSGIMTYHITPSVAKSIWGKPARQTRVLIAEDEEKIRNKAALQLMKSGMRVKKVAAPGRLDILLDSFKPDVLILDDHFEKSGKGFTTIIPNVIGRHPRTKVIVTTRQPESELVPGRRPTAWGATSVMEKSRMFEKSSTLPRAVRKILDHDL